MKHFNNLKLLTSFREISAVFRVIANTIRIFTFLLVLLQGIMLIKETKESYIQKI
ncbi:MAG: hypothetical protein LIO62_06440 [Clostridiales bacterium]|nr:hypothetical protein [Clostridiales bacterium]